MGWSYFNLGDYENSEQAFSDQSARHSNGAFAFDAEMMVGESRFKRKDYKTSLSAYQKARAWIRDKNETSQTIRDASERQIRELAFLHGGQSAAQLKQWDEAIKWYDELRERFPTTAYLPQAFYETGFAYQLVRVLDYRTSAELGRVAEAITCLGVWYHRRDFDQHVGI